MLWTYPQRAGFRAFIVQFMQWTVFCFCSFRIFSVPFYIFSSFVLTAQVEEPHKAEIVTSLKGTVIRCAEESADMYKSIDEVCDRLNRKLVKYKERRLEGFHGGKSMSEDLADALNAVEVSGEDGAAVEDFVDPDAPTITKVKSYDLSKKISVQEAVFALDYVDHDFYVFRNDEDGEINVVYKRNAGGVGLIQPSQ